MVAVYLEYSASKEKLWSWFVWLLYNLIWMATALTAFQAALMRDTVRKGLCVAFVACAMVVGGVFWKRYSNRSRAAGVATFNIVALGLDILAVMNGASLAETRGWISSLAATSVFYAALRLSAYPAGQGGPAAATVAG